jgi:hypothetical protein
MELQARFFIVSVLLVVVEGFKHCRYNNFGFGYPISIVCLCTGCSGGGCSCRGSSSSSSSSSSSIVSVKCCPHPIFTTDKFT